jgi:polyhydroxyalkanoate synthase subunit PhaC
MEKGYLPATAMANAFNMLRSNDLIWSYVVSNYMLGREPFPFDLLYWNADSTAMPARVHHFYLDRFYSNNAFARDALEVAGEKLLLSDIDVPVYHVAPREDHIAPAASVWRGAQRMSGAVTRFIVSGSGHIAGIVNPPASGKYQYWTNPDSDSPDIEHWLKTATETAGSWWPDWDAWLKGRNGGTVPARVPGAVSSVVEPAPGSFVKVRFDKR